MLAAVFHGPGDVRLEQRPAPSSLGAGDVKIRVLGTGVCGTDRAIMRGLFSARKGVVLGHEAIGEVAAVGDQVDSFKPGDRVIVNPTLFCGRCPYCLRGRPGLCRAKAGTEVGVDRDGTFAELAVLPQRFLFSVPESLSLERAVLVEPLACVLNNLMAARVGVSDAVLVLGGGPIGSLVGMAAKRAARTVTIVEADGFRREHITEIGLAVAAPPDGSRDWLTWANALPGGRPDVVVDTTGVLLGQALDVVADGGRVVLMGFNADATAVVRYQNVVARALTIVGAGDYNEPVFPLAIDLAHELPLEKLVTHRVALAQFDRVSELLGLGRGGAEYRAMKIVVGP